MKVLLIQVGNPTDKSQLDPETKYISGSSLTDGEVFFDEKQIINNVQTRQGLENLGCEMVVYYHTNRRGLKGLVQSSLAIRKLVREHNPDLTHIIWGGVSGFLGTLFCPGKSIVSLLGSDLFGNYHPSGQKKLSSKIQTLCSRLCAITASGVIVMSSRMKKYMWGFRNNRVHVIPEGLLLSKFSPGNRQNSIDYLGWDENKFIVIFFYEGQPVKNWSLAEKAFIQFKQSCPEAELKIIKGFQHDELVHVYRAADCLLMTSLHEGSNNSVKEAMACDLPVVSVPCGDAEERLSQLENSYVAEYDAADISSKLMMVRNSQSRSNGSRFIHEVEIPHCSKMIVDLYKKTITAE